MSNSSSVSFLPRWSDGHGDKNTNGRVVTIPSEVTTEPVPVNVVYLELLHRFNLRCQILVLLVVTVLPRDSEDVVDTVITLEGPSLRLRELSSLVFIWITGNIPTIFPPTSGTLKYRHSDSTINFSIAFISQSLTVSEMTWKIVSRWPGDKYLVCHLHMSLFVT